MANQCTTIAFNSPALSNVEELDPFDTDKLIQIDDSNSQLLVSQDMPTPPEIKEQTSVFKLMPVTQQTTNLDTSPEDYEFIHRVDFNREKFFKEVCHIIKPERDLIKETLRHFETKSKERTAEIQTAVKPKQAAEQKRKMLRGARAKRPGTLGSNILHCIQSKKLLELKKPSTKVVAKKFKSPVIQTHRSRVFSTNIAAILKNSRKDSLQSTQRKSRSRVNSNSLPMKQKINVYSFEVGKGEIASNVQSRGSPFKAHDLELKDPSNNLYTNRVSRENKEMRELSELLEIDSVCRFDEVITSVKKIKKDLEESKLLAKNLMIENGLLKTRIAIQESSIIKDIKLIEKPTVQTNYHSNSKYVQASFMSKNTTSRDYKQAPFESTISMTSGPDQFEKGFNHKKNSLSNLTSIHAITSSGQLRKLKRVLASKAASNLHSMLDAHMTNLPRNFTITDRTH